MILKNYRAVKLHGLNILFNVIVFFIALYFVPARMAFCYGVMVALVNLLLLYVFYYWYRRRVARYLGQGLVVMTQTVVVRFFVVGCLLVVGFYQLAFSPFSLVLGFVLGQVFYLLNQLVRVLT